MAQSYVWQTPTSWFSGETPITEQRLNLVSNDLLFLFNQLPGQSTSYQNLTVGYELIINNPGGLLPTSGNPGGILLIPNSYAPSGTAQYLFGHQGAADVYPRLALDVNINQGGPAWYWGDGAHPPDASLARSSANRLSFNATLDVNNFHVVGGVLGLTVGPYTGSSHASTGLGVYGDSEFTGELAVRNRLTVAPAAGPHALVLAEDGNIYIQDSGASILSGVPGGANRAITIYADQNVYIGDTPSDPGGSGKLEVQGDVTSKNDITAIGGMFANNISNLIATQKIGSRVNSVTFSNIPQTYSHLVLVVSGRVFNPTAPTYSRIFIQFNGDTTTIFHTLEWEFNINGAGTASWVIRSATGPYYMGVLSTTFNNQPTVADSAYTLLVGNYASTSTTKSLQEFSGDAVNGQNYSHLVGAWPSNSAVNALLVSTDSTGSFEVGTIFSLYGQV